MHVARTGNHVVFLVSGVHPMVWPMMGRMPVLRRSWPCPGTIVGRLTVPVSSGTRQRTWSGHSMAMRSSSRSRFSYPIRSSWKFHSIAGERRVRFPLSLNESRSGRDRMQISGLSSEKVQGFPTSSHHLLNPIPLSYPRLPWHPISGIPEIEISGTYAESTSSSTGQSPVRRHSPATTLHK